MVYSCCAVGCNNKVGKKSVSFHRFPANQEQRQKWIEAVKRDGWQPTSATRLCSAHFAKGKRNYNPLSPNFVPSIFNHTSSQKLLHKIQEIEAFERRQKMKIKKRKVASRQTAATAQVRMGEPASTAEEFNTSITPGRNSEDLASPDYAPAVFVNQTPKEKRKRKQALEAYSRWRKPNKTGKSRTKAASSAGNEAIPLTDTDTVSIDSATTECESTSKVPTHKKPKEQRDEQNAEESTNIPLSCSEKNNCNAVPDVFATSVNAEENLIDNCYYDAISSDDSDDDDNGNRLKYEDPTTLLLTGKTKELMKLLQIYRKNIAKSVAPKHHEEPSGSREKRSGSAAAAHSEHDSKHRVIRGNHTVIIDGVKYMHLLSYNEEKEFIDFIRHSYKICTGISLEELCHRVCNFCIISNIAVPSAWTDDPLAAMEWVKGFVRRRSLSHLLIPCDWESMDDGKNLGGGDAVAGRENTASKPVPEIYVCDDGTLRSSATVTDNINLDHSYALYPPCELLAVIDPFVMIDTVKPNQ